jgi:hypothetical protein
VQSFTWLNTPNLLQSLFVKWAHPQQYKCLQFYVLRTWTCLYCSWFCYEKVEGMVCSMCRFGTEIRENLQSKTQILELIWNRAKVLYRTALVDDHLSWELLISNSGDHLIVSRFWIEGVTSPSCPDSVEAALNQLLSTKRAFVALITKGQRLNTTEDWLPCATHECSQRSCCRRLGREDMQPIRTFHKTADGK